MECSKCRAAFEATAATAPPYTQGFVAVVKDWRWWVVAVVLTVLAGMTAGVLHRYHSGLMGLSGAAIAIFTFSRARTMLKCPKCSAVFQSAPLLGAKKTG